MALETPIHAVHTEPRVPHGPSSPPRLVPLSVRIPTSAPRVRTAPRNYWASWFSRRFRKIFPSRDGETSCNWTELP